MVHPVEKRIKGLSGMIGNTPLLEIHLLYEGEERIIYAKAENLNMTGSILSLIISKYPYSMVHQDTLPKPF